MRIVIVLLNFSERFLFYVVYYVYWYIGGSLKVSMGRIVVGYVLGGRGR